MRKSNRKIGTDFERVFCDMLAEKDFWVHNFVQGESGQPADVIAVKNGKAFLIDCKVCDDVKKGFELKRIEANQQSSMTMFNDCGNGVGWFALRLPKEDNPTEYEVLMTSLQTLLFYAGFGVSSLTPKILRSGVAIPFEEWLEVIKERKVYESRDF